MKEHPIIFSAPMVRAIIDGRKTQTRRVLKYQPIRCTELPVILFPQSRDESIMQTGFIWPNAKEQILARCPYGQLGDRLWVRETFQGPLLESEEHEAQFHNDGPDAFKKPGFCAYRATDTLDAVDADGNDLGWRPSIYMPRWASRILLEITDVRVERLQDISEEDAKAEGADCLITANCTDKSRALLDLPLMEDANPYRNGYALLWESINGDGAWVANPWVWVVEFKRAEGGAA